MQVKDIWEEVKEVTGLCDEAANYRAITRAVEMLANQGLFDPLIGTVDFTVNGAYYVALPRDVKTPIRLNINNNPAVARNRLFEFLPNSPGSVDGAEVGWQWHERGYSCIQDERKLPSRLRYIVTSSNDIGKELKLAGIDPTGYERAETLIGSAASPALSHFTYSEVRTVLRDVTDTEATLVADTGIIARYYGDEVQPDYRVIKISQTGVGIRMVYRKHVFKISAQEDIIPLHSPLAVIQAVAAVRLLQQRKYEESTAALAVASGLIGQEQQTRDEGEAISARFEIETALNTNIHADGILIAADIYDDASDIFGGVGRSKLFDRMTDAVQLLAHKSPWDSMTATAILTADTAGLVTLPRFVHAPLAVNIANQPSFARSRLFEYSLNTKGHEDGETLGYTWALGGESPLLVDPPAASVLTVTGDAADNTLSLTFYGLDASGLEISEVITISATGTAGTKSFAKVTRVIKPVTAKFVTVAAGATALARYYPDETEPNYRRIRVSKPSATVRVLFKKQSPRITGLFDLIPLRSRLAVVTAMRATKLLHDGNAQGSEALLASAVAMLEDEMGSSTDQITDQIQTAINANIHANDVLIVADIYDMASEILGPIGQAKLFDRMTDAINVLANKSPWDSLLGSVDVRRADNWDIPTAATAREGRAGYFVLPRQVGAVLAVNTGGIPTIPRNRWFEFHLNGPGSRGWASCGAWDDAGDVCVVSQIPRTPDGRDRLPVKLLAIPANILDVDKKVTVYGMERDATGRDVEVWRGGAPGFVVPCKQLTNYDAPSDAPAFVRIDRITREATTGFVRLVGYSQIHTVVPAREEYLFGYWYPDEIEPTYRMIRVAHCPCQTIRIRYRKRTSKVTSLNDVIQLRSRLAMENMLRALAVQGSNPLAANAFENAAMGYLAEEQEALNPIRAGGLQFDEGTSPGVTGNIQ